MEDNIIKLPNQTIVLTYDPTNRAQSIKIENVPQLQDAVNILATAFIQLYNRIMADANQSEKEQYTELRNELYDMYNSCFSNILDLMAVDLDRETNPDFTVQAMQYAEDILLLSQLSQIPEHEIADRQEYVETYLESVRQDMMERMAKA